MGWTALKQEIQKCVVSNMGSATHHHAVGKDHAESFAVEVGKQTIDWIVAMKRHFDPNYILNPGVLIHQQSKL